MTGSVGGAAGSTATGLVTVLPNAYCATQVPDSQVQAAVRALDGLAEAMVSKAALPGMAVAVVHQGKQVYGRGFGVRKVGEAPTVDADTVFQLASISKPVGATVVAHEVSAQRVSWDTPVSTHCPDWRLADPYVTDHVTVADLYSHRSGLPAHAGDLLEDLGYSRQQVLGRLALLSLDPFRASYGYTNFGITAAATAVANAAGVYWEELSAQVLYSPLGMTNTSSLFAVYAARPNRAWTHVQVDGTWRAAVVRDADAQSPAGGVSSSVNDMAAWMTMVLSGGKGPGGEPVVAPEALLPAVTPQVVAAPATDPASRSGFYGFGFNVSIQPSAMPQVSHSGGFNAGAGTNLVLMPTLGLGIVTLTNASPTGAAEALNQEFLDLVQYGAPTFDWFTLYQALLAAGSAPTGRYAGQTPPANAAPPGPLTAYLGEYGNDYVGDVRVVEQGDGLALRLGVNGRLIWPLTHWDGDVLVAEPTGEMANPGSVSAVTFGRSDGPAARTMTIEYYEQTGYGTFVRAQ